MKDIDKLTPEERAEYSRLILSTQPRRRQPFVTTGPPDHLWKIIPGILGLPVERESRHIHHPFVIIGLILVFIGVQYYGIKMNLEAFVNAYGFIPGDWTRHHYMTIFSSFFIHGGWLHLIGNTYYFYVFGDDVEDELHLPKFLLLLFGSHSAGLLAHTFFDSSLTLPLVGASAGISGLLGYYMIRYPQRQVSYMLLLLIFPYWFHVPAFFALFFKFGWEMLIASSGIRSGVAHWAHIGGAAFGIFFALAHKERQKKVF